jgi:hypothetical protein
MNRFFEVLTGQNTVDMVLWAVKTAASEEINF